MAPGTSEFSINWANPIYTGSLELQFTGGSVGPKHNTTWLYYGKELQIPDHWPKTNSKEGSSEMKSPSEILLLILYSLKFKILESLTRHRKRLLGLLLCVPQNERTLHLWVISVT